MMVIPTSRVGIYARVSASDKDLNPATQLLPLREFVTTRGWTIAGEFVDHASARDPRPRTAWRNLLDQASRRRVDLVLVWRIDRAFRSVHEVANTLERFRKWNVGLRSYSEPWLDTTSPFGEALYCITIAYGQLERGIVSQRVRAGRERAGRQRKRLGRRRAVNGEWVQFRPQIENGEMTWRGVPQGLGVGPGTAHRISWSGGDLGPTRRRRAEAAGDGVLECRPSGAGPVLPTPNVDAGPSCLHYAKLGFLVLRSSRPSRWTTLLPCLQMVAIDQEHDR